MNADVITGLFTLLGVAIGVVGTVFLAPKIREKFKLREIYLAPFRKWCADFYGELDEFWGKYLSCTANRTNYSNVEIIDDWRALHEVVMDGPKWLAKIKTEDETIANKLDNLLRIIDHIWHESEEEYNVRLRDRFDIISLGKVIRERMADHLWGAKDKSKKNILEDREAITPYLRKQIP